jgi:hypothetical protein
MEPFTSSTENALNSIHTGNSSTYLFSVDTDASLLSTPAMESFIPSKLESHTRTAQEVVLKTLAKEERRRRKKDVIKKLSARPAGVVISSSAIAIDSDEGEFP